MGGTMTASGLNEQCKGVFAISATPFSEDGALDLAGTDQLIDFYLGCGVHGITILGVMGEANKMSEAESEAFLRRVLGRVAGQLPVVVGVTHSALSVVASLTRKSLDAGAAGVMLQPMAGLKGDDAVYAYFETVLEAIGPRVPVCYQDYPQASGVHLSVPVWNRMVDDFSQLVMLKHEDLPGLMKLSRIRDDERRDWRRRVSILVGNNALYFPHELRRGADGAMTGFAYPDVLVRVHALFAAGEEDAAEDLFDLYLPINRYEQQPGFGLAARKEVLHRRGALRTATARAPATRLTATEHAEIDGLMARLERKAPPLAAVAE